MSKVYGDVVAKFVQFSHPLYKVSVGQVRDIVHCLLVSLYGNSNNVFTRNFPAINDALLSLDQILSCAHHSRYFQKTVLYIVSVYH